MNRICYDICKLKRNIRQQKKCHNKSNFDLTNNKRYVIIVL